MNKIEIDFIVNTPIDNNVGRRVKRLVETLSYTSTEVDVHWASLFEEGILSKLADMLKLLFSKVRLVHIIEPFGPSFIFLIPFIIAGKKIIYQTGDIHYKTAELVAQRGPKFLLFKLSEKFHYFFSNNILVGSVGHKEFLCSVFGMKNEKIKKVNYFGCPDVDDGKFLYSDQSDVQNSLIYLLRRKTSGKFVIAFSASLRVLKIGKDYVPRGWEIPFIVDRLVNVYHNDVSAIILGEGPGKSLIEAISVNLGIKDRVLTIGNATRKDYFRILDIASIFFVESFDHITYSIMYPSKISDYVYAGKPFIWSFNPESSPWNDYPLLVKPAKLLDNFFVANEEYISEVTSLIDRFINDDSFRTMCYSGFGKMKSGLPSWTGIANDVIVLYKKLNTMSPTSNL